MVFNIKIIDKHKGISYSSISSPSKIKADDRLTESFWNEGVVCPVEYVENNMTIHFKIYID